MRTLHALTLVTTLFLAGCQTPDEPVPQHAKRVQVARYDSTPYPKKSHFEVLDTSFPTRPHKVIALLTCEGAPKEEAPMLTAIFYRARQLGADGVMSAETAVTAKGEPIFIGRGGGFGGGVSSRCVFRAKAFVYTQSP